MTNDLSPGETLTGKLNQETAKAPWRELQKFFASGVTVYVEPGMNLIAVAAVVAEDNKAQVEEWMAAGKVAPVSDEQAASWYEQDATVWAVVVKPLVLVQPVAADR